jgi:hypothetical protein
VSTVLDARALNRALMARQLLLERQAMPALGAIEHVIGLQAQEPLEPYVGLWSRLRDFDPAELVELIESRRAVRTHLMRRTLHLVSADDALSLRPQFQSMLEARMLGSHGRQLEGVDLRELAAIGRPLFEEQPRIVAELGRALVDRWPGVVASELGSALLILLPLVQVPPRGIWGCSGPARLMPMDAWLGRPLADPAPPLDALVRRYLAAFGPASAADIRSWSGLTGLKETIDRLRPELREFRDESGRVLLDVPDGPLPDPDVPVQPRFVPAFDNVVLGFADRTRIIDDAHKSLSADGARFVLVDGRVAGRWTVDRRDGSAVLRVSRLRPLARGERDSVAEEGRRLATFLMPDATDVDVAFD